MLVSPAPSAAAVQSKPFPELGALTGTLGSCTGLASGVSPVVTATDSRARCTRHPALRPPSRRTRCVPYVLKPWVDCTLGLTYAVPPDGAIYGLACATGAASARVVAVRTIVGTIRAMRDIWLSSSGNDQMCTRRERSRTPSLGSSQRAFLLHRVAAIRGGSRPVRPARSQPRARQPDR